jgi:hypothetical protein
LTITEEEVDRFLLGVEQTCREIEASSSLVDGLISKSVAGHHDATGTGGGAVLSFQTMARVAPPRSGAKQAE